MRKNILTQKIHAQKYTHNKCTHKKYMHKLIHAQKILAHTKIINKPRAHRWPYWSCFSLDFVYFSPYTKTQCPPHLALITKRIELQQRSVAFSKMCILKKRKLKSDKDYGSYDYKQVSEYLCPRQYWYYWKKVNYVIHFLNFG